MVYRYERKSPFNVQLIGGFECIFKINPHIVYVWSSNWYAFQLDHIYYFLVIWHVFNESTQPFHCLCWCIKFTTGGDMRIHISNIIWKNMGTIWVLSWSILRFFWGLGNTVDGLSFRLYVYLFFGDCVRILWSWGRGSDPSKKTHLRA